MGITVRLKPKFPARVLATNGLQVTKSNGAYTIAPKTEDLTAVTESDISAAHTVTWVVLYNSTTGTYRRISIENLIDATAGDYPDFTGDSGSGGVRGLVPAPAAGDAAASKFLFADGTWASPAAIGGALTQVNNLSDVDDAEEAVINLGLKAPLAADSTFWVRTDGNDSVTPDPNASDNAANAFLTWQAALDYVVGKYNFNTKTVTIKAGGSGQRTFATSGASIITILEPWIGGGKIIFEGDTGTKDNVRWNVTSADAVEIGDCYGTVEFKGIRVSTITSGVGFDLVGSCKVFFTGYMYFVAHAGGFIKINNDNAYLSLATGVTMEFEADPTSGLAILVDSGYFGSAGTILVTGSRTFTGGLIECNFRGFCWIAAITGSWTGPDYVIKDDAAIRSSIAESSWGGSTAGSIGTGGCFIDGLNGVSKFTSTTVTATTGAITTVNATTVNTTTLAATGNATVSGSATIGAAATTQFAIASTGLFTQRNDDAALTTFGTLRNLGVTGTTQGATLNFEFGTGGASGGNAAQLVVLSTEDWSAAANRSAKARVNARTDDTLSVEMDIGNGVQCGAPTGGAKGVGTLNATAVYDDNTLLTDIVQEFAATGTVNTAKWDAMVPDRVIPESREQVPVLIEVEREMQELKPAGGGFELVTERRTVREQLTLFAPVWDRDGNGIDAIEEPQFDEVVVPERREKRTHYAAHLFKKMLAEGFDPRNPDAYLAKLTKDRALPGMPTEAEWQHGKFSLGEMHTRMCLATEILAQAFAGLRAKVTALEAASARSLNQ